MSDDLDGGIDRPEVDADTLEFDTEETHGDSLGNEVTRHYYECPNPDCDCSMCRWMDCPVCLWYDEDVWSRTLEEEGVPA